MKTGAEILLECLKLEGVDTIDAAGNIKPFISKAGGASLGEKQNRRDRADNGPVDHGDLRLHRGDCGADETCSMPSSSFCPRSKRAKRSGTRSTSPSLARARPDYLPHCVALSLG